MSSETAHMEPTADHLAEEPHLHEGHSTMLGFWMYLMSDCLIFAILFATYAVLGGSYAGGPGPKDLFDLPLLALNTAMLLFSSIKIGRASCRERVCQYVLITVVPRFLKKKKQ